METITLRKTNRILDLDTKKAKRTFLVLNILLSTGVITIVSTLLYLLIHLNQSDIVIYECVFCIVSGLVLVLFYAIGYHELKKNKNCTSHIGWNL
jgi:undecaprenyl pyrophosphate phosphatase UppP